MVEPVLLALTITPSMAPSSCELTRPVRAAGVKLWAASTRAAKRIATCINKMATMKRVPLIALMEYLRWHTVKNLQDEPSADSIKHSDTHQYPCLLSQTVRACQVIIPLW